MPIGFTQAGQSLDIGSKAMDMPSEAEPVVPVRAVTDMDVEILPVVSLSRLSSVDFHPRNRIGSHKNGPGIRTRDDDGGTTEHSTS